MPPPPMASMRLTPSGSAGSVSSVQAVLEEVAVAETPFTNHSAVPDFGTVTLKAFVTVPPLNAVGGVPLTLDGVIEFSAPTG